jgi:hypothetical protein
MQPIEPDVAEACTVGGQVAVAEISCHSAAVEQPLGYASSIRSDAGRRVYGR